MFFAGRVRGSLGSSQPIVVGITTVYVHENIKEIEVQDETTEETRIEYEYDEYQYDKDEYIQMMAEQNERLKEDLVMAQDALDALIMDDDKDDRILALEEQLAVTQEALDALIMGGE